MVNLDIAIVLSILVASLILFITEKLPMDVVALLVLGALALTGIVSPKEALAGFSNPAVITVWAVFMLSGGLSKTGIAKILGEYMLKLAGTGQTRIIIVIMLTSGILSAFMNNIGVAALLLPVVMDIARRTDNPPSRLLMPLAYGSLLGGLTTLIGTPPNLLVSEALALNGLEPFSLFDFSPVGGFVMLGGVAFIALFGRRFLPIKDPVRDSGEGGAGLHLREQYAEAEQMFVMRPAANSMLVGKTLAESRLGSALDLNVFAVVRDGRTRLAPDPQMVLQGSDKLLVQGKMDRFKELTAWRELVIEGRDPDFEDYVWNHLVWARVELAEDSDFEGKTLFEIDLHRRFGVSVAGIFRDGENLRSNLLPTLIEPGDALMVQGRSDQIQALENSSWAGSIERFTAESLPEEWKSGDRVFSVRLTEGSRLVGRTLDESRLGDVLGLRILGHANAQRIEVAPGSTRVLEAGDRLLLAGDRKDLYVLRGLQQLTVESERSIDPTQLESEDVGLVEVILSPRTRLAGKSLRQIRFRERYGARVLAVLRGGEAIRSDLGALHLRLGDALLLLGERKKLELLKADPEFLILTGTVDDSEKTSLAPVSLLIMAGVMLPVLLGWLPISIAAVVGATLMVVTGCLSMDEAYRSVEWRSIFLIAGMLPLGVAMSSTGAAELVAEGILALLGPFGLYGALIGLYLVTALATAIIPTAALVVLMAPIVLKTSAEMGLSPYSAMMAVSIAASASFTSPISHPANVLVMGPGGYRFVDYVKLGVPLTILIFIIVLIVLPIFWPLAAV